MMSVFYWTNKFVAKKYCWPGLYMHINVYVGAIALLHVDYFGKCISILYTSPRYYHCMIFVPQLETCEHCHCNNRNCWFHSPMFLRQEVLFL